MVVVGVGGGVCRCRGLEEVLEGELDLAVFVDGGGDGGEGGVAEALVGTPNWEWLRMLKNSARNSRFWASKVANFL